MGFFH